MVKAEVQAARLRANWQGLVDALKRREAGVNVDMCLQPTGDTRHTVCTEWAMIRSQRRVCVKCPFCSHVATEAGGLITHVHHKCPAAAAALCAPASAPSTAAAPAMTPPPTPPLAPAAADATPPSTPSPESGGEGDGALCVICCEPVRGPAGEPAEDGTVWGHARCGCTACFHKKCLTHWLTTTEPQRSDCPACMQGLPRVKGRRMLAAPRPASPPQPPPSDPVAGGGDESADEGNEGDEDDEDGDGGPADDAAVVVTWQPGASQWNAVVMGRRSRGTGLRRRLQLNVQFDADAKHAWVDATTVCPMPHAPSGADCPAATRPDRTT